MFFSYRVKENNDIYWCSSLPRHPSQCNSTSGPLSRSEVHRQPCTWSKAEGANASHCAVSYPCTSCWNRSGFCVCVCVCACLPACVCVCVGVGVCVCFKGQLAIPLLSFQRTGFCLQPVHQCSIGLPDKKSVLYSWIKTFCWNVITITQKERSKTQAVKKKENKTTTEFSLNSQIKVYCHTHAYQIKL